MDSQLGGFAASSPTGANGSSDDSTSQLVQAMAGFDSGGGAANGLNITQPAADTSQQTFLTTPHGMTVLRQQGDDKPTRIEGQ